MKTVTVGICYIEKLEEYYVNLLFLKSSPKNRNFIVICFYRDL